MTKISVKVIPKSSRQKLKYEGNTLKVWLHPAPEDGKANAELVRILAKKFRVPKGDISILRGETSRNKVVDIEGITMEVIQKIA